MATDHCPYTHQQKLAVNDDFNKIPNGAAGPRSGARTCEAQTSYGYLLGYPATACYQVPCSTDYFCTLDGGTKGCSNGSWVPVY